MTKSVRIAPTELADGQAITFTLAVGSSRQVCRLHTTFRTQNQALSYFHKHRTAFEQIARASLARGEIEAGVIHLTML
jgi:hypothetical protein